MSRLLCTFPGKYGDILWSLATVKRISEMCSAKVDFMMMPQYKSLTDLIKAQPYIDDVKISDAWVFMHSNYGDQPWNPQPPVQAWIDQNYAHHWHLGYRAHPGKTFGNVELQLIDFTAWQQGITFPANPLPFLFVPDGPIFGKSLLEAVGLDLDLRKPFVAVGFNEQYESLKKGFLDCLKLTLGNDVTFVDVTKQPWLAAAYLISQSLCFVGCRSANFVIAHGLAKQMVIFEPHPARNVVGHLGTVFGCSYGAEVDTPFAMPPGPAADFAVQIIRHWIKNKAQGVHDEAVTTVTGGSSGQANNSSSESKVRSDEARKR